MNKRILDELYNKQGDYISGQKLSQILGVSRTTIWKNIRELTEQGYEIKAEGGKGYLLSDGCDVLNSYEIHKRISKNIEIHYVNSVNSTNNMAKNMAPHTQKDFSLIVAGSQSGGRGRMGKKFESDNEKGVWCSFILKPEIQPEKALSVTIASSIAVCRTLEDVCDIKAGIKWPNDIIISNKKVCGILSEMSCETGVINHIVIGIGINVLQQKKDFPTDIHDKATSILMETGREFNRAKIIASLCYNMLEVFEHLKTGSINEFLKFWKDYTLTDGRRIKVFKNEKNIEMKALGIDDQGKLIVVDDKGNKSKFTSGEISIRGVLGYI